MRAIIKIRLISTFTSNRVIIKIKFNQQEKIKKVIFIKLSIIIKKEHHFL